MVFADLFFIYVFLPLCLICYGLAKKLSTKNIVLIVFSLIFYAWGEPLWILLLLFSSFFNWFIGILIGKFRDTPRAKLAVGGGIFVDILLLLIFKYSAFIVENLNAVSGAAIPVPQITLPIGISFYTFQAISYILDCYWETVDVQPKYHKFLLYLSLFPQLIAGPIVRYHDVALQIEKRSTTSGLFLDGFWRFAVGLAKKVFLANTFARLADLVFDTPPSLMTTTQAWAGVLAYTFQLYYDFAGYSDMAIGLGRMMGFQFLENFNFPYASAGIGEFWRRWHISLGRFMMEYLYVPLGGNRKGHGRTVFNLWLVFLASGFWHGAAWTFILWGIWHGTLISIEKTLGPERMKRIPRPLAIAGTFLLVALGWVLFRSGTIHRAGGFYLLLFNLMPDGAGLAAFPEIMADRALWLAAAIGIPCAFAPALRLERFLPRDAENPDAVPLGIVALRFAASVLIFAVVASEMCASGFNPFIYFQF